VSSLRSPASKVLGRAELIARFGRPRDQRLVFTNGCFDLLHRGHAACLFEARSLGDILVVGVNDDASVRRLKGEGRPLRGVLDRAFLLGAFESVDVVTIFEEDTPLELIRLLVPDVLVKGGDYAEGDIVGSEVVRAAGGEVRALSFVDGASTSGIIERIQETGARRPPVEFQSGNLDA